MVGLNHEFARELLWREYPTDQRPSSFRQFWDVSQLRERRELEPKDLEEKPARHRADPRMDAASHSATTTTAQPGGNPPERRRHRCSSGRWCW